MAEIKIAGVGRAGDHPKIVCFRPQGLKNPHVGLILNRDDDANTKVIADLVDTDVVNDLTEIITQDSPVDFLASRISSRESRLATFVYDPALVQIDAPVDINSLNFEVWCAGVTYEDSKKNRRLESDAVEGELSPYDKVYVDDRPELFFKATPRRVNGTNTKIGLRFDSKWMVSEPEIALVINPKGKVVGLTICNDQSSRDIEGANSLYLPQAKLYIGGCAVGPVIALDYSEAETRKLKISMQITRGGKSVFQGQTSYGEMKKERTFENLTGYLFRANEFPDGVFLSTGTGIIPPPEFTLEEGDVVKITVDDIGELENTVIEV